MVARLIADLGDRDEVINAERGQKHERLANHVDVTGSQCETARMGVTVNHVNHFRSRTTPIRPQRERPLRYSFDEKSVQTELE